MCTFFFIFKKKKQLVDEQNKKQKNCQSKAERYVRLTIHHWISKICRNELLPRAMSKVSLDTKRVLHITIDDPLPRVLVLVGRLLEEERIEEIDARLSARNDSCQRRKRHASKFEHVTGAGRAVITRHAAAKSNALVKCFVSSAHLQKKSNCV